MIHRTGTCVSRMRYSIRVSARISMGSGVRMRKPSQGGVRTSRFSAFEKKKASPVPGTVPLMGPLVSAGTWPVWKPRWQVQRHSPPYSDHSPCGPQ